MASLKNYILFVVFKKVKMKELESLLIFCLLQMHPKTSDKFCI